MADVYFKEARGCKAAFNFETGDINNKLVVGRKGVIRADIEVERVSAHAGREPEKGKNAILEISHKVIDIQRLSDFERGITYNVGVIKGGTVPNAVPDFCQNRN